jgi:hypothetical protein
MDGDEKVLVDVAAWLVINSMRSERIQFNQLCIQNVSNVWRKNAFKTLLKNHTEYARSCPSFTAQLQRTLVTDSSSFSPLCRFKIHQKLEDVHLRKSLQVFREPIDFSVEACVPEPKPFHVAIEDKIQANADFVYGEGELGIVQKVRELVQQKRKKTPKKEVPADGAEAEIEKRRKAKAKRKRLLNSSGHFFDAEKVQEQEQEREQQQEQEVRSGFQHDMLLLLLLG